jgi:phosphate uptake regulator
METRKVQTVGNGTYTVSLPKEWAESHDLAAGEIVTVHEHLDGVLALQSGDQSNGELPATADVDTGDSAVLERALRAAYASGVREVTIHHDGSLTAAHRDVVERVTRERVGMSVTAESGAATTVQILLDSTEVSVSQSLRQLSFAVCSIHRDAVHALAAPPATSPVDSRHDQVDRLSAMVERSVARGMADLGEVDALGTTRSELFESWTAMRALGRVHDAATSITDAAASLEDAPADARLDPCHEIGDDACEAVSDGVDVVLGDADVTGARCIIADLRRIRDRLDDFDRALDDATNDVSALRRVSRELRRTAVSGTDIAEVGLRRAVRRGDSICDRA